MRILLQRVESAAVSINSRLESEIGKGLLVLVGIEDADNADDVNWVVKKIVNLRIFDDANKVMNLSIKDVGGNILVVSQFTLHAQIQKGNRPSYIKASKPQIAIPIYKNLCERLSEELEMEVKTGVFGADMQVELINDGPVTIWIDSKKKE